MMRRAVAGAVVAVVLGASGCTDEAEPAMTKAQYVEEGNEICADAADALTEAADETQGDLAVQIGFVQAEVVPSIRRQIDDLRRLGYPPGDEEELDQLLDDSEDILILVARDPASALRTGGDTPFAAVNERFVDYGLTECGED